MRDEESNVVIVQRDGPNVATGDLALVTGTRVRVMTSAVLCRCGRSLDKPFCDGAHVKQAFSDPACLAVGGTPLAARPGRLTITPLPNGPNRCEGPVLIRGADGRAITTDATLLCRCGASRTKPFCDGSHVKVGFRG
jgi:CDGSH-type Zn-finger protein